MPRTAAVGGEPTGTDAGVPTPAAADWILVGLLTALSGFVAVLGIFFLPVYSGSVPVPFVVVVVGVALFFIPRAAYRLTHRMPAALAPVLIWAIVTVWLYVTTNALYLNTAVTWQGWQFYVLLGVGALVAAASVGLLWSDHLAAELEAQRVRARVQR